MKIRVLCYEGYRARETPRTLLLGDRRVDVAAVLDRWRGQDHEYVKLTGSDGNRYIIRYSAGDDEWELVLMEVEPQGQVRDPGGCAPQARGSSCRAPWPAARAGPRG